MTALHDFDPHRLPLLTSLWLTLHLCHHRLVNHLLGRHYEAENTLLAKPLQSRTYQMELSFMTLHREAALRQVTLHHAHQVEIARKMYEAEKAKVEDEAKQARKLQSRRCQVGCNCNWKIPLRSTV